jgi:hypothetical protein
VLIVLRVRRFVCASEACAKVTFAEQVPGLTSRYSRRTCDLHKVLQAVGLALGGQAGARLSGKPANCADSPKDSAKTGPPSPPGSPCPTAPAPSKASSTASK